MDSSHALIQKINAAAQHLGWGLESVDGIRQRVGLITHAHGGSSGFFDQRGVLLRHLVDF
jgi:hypothetical protein